MRFPSSLARSMGAYMLRRKLLGPKRFPMVLMLEPLHACNLRCEGCGRIREYPETMGQTMTVDECVASVEECGAPIVSICGGEPLIYSGLVELVARLVRMRKHLYLCTNGQLLEEKLPEIASANVPGLRERLYFNVHLDGPAELHDSLTGRSGSFEKAVAGLAAAKDAGFLTYVNTTVYRKTTVDALVALGERLKKVRIDGIMVSPAYGYEAVIREREGGKNAEKPAGGDAENRTGRALPVVSGDGIFLSRGETHAFFKELRVRMREFPLTATPVFMDFLCGERRLDCAAWANPTRNIRGWRAPCYLVADTHYPTWRELMENVDWTGIGPGNDPHCRNCLTHCGFEPSSVLAVRSLAQIFRMLRWQMGAKLK